MTFDWEGFRRWVSETPPQRIEEDPRHALIDIHERLLALEQPCNECGGRGYNTDIIRYAPCGSCNPDWTRVEKPWREKT